MAIQQLNPGRSGLSILAENLGAGLGSGFNTGLGSARQASGLQALGFSPAEAQGVSGLPPHIQQEFVKQRLQAPSQQAYAQALSSLLGGTAQPGQSSQQGMAIPQGLNAQQATQLAQLSLQKQAKESQLEERHREQIKKYNAPYIKKLDEGADAARKVYSIAQRMNELLATGKVASLAKGQLSKATKGLFGKDETREFQALSNELAILKSKAETGGALRALGLVKLMQEAKPDVAQDRRTQQNRVNDILKEASRGLQMDEIRHYLINKEGGEPANIHTRIEDFLKKIPKISEDVHEGDVWVDEDTGQYYTIRNGIQVPIMEPKGV